MLKKVLGLLLSIVLIFLIGTYREVPNAQTISKKEDILLPMYIDYKCGFINQNGKVVIEPSFEFGFSSVNGYALGVCTDININSDGGDAEYKYVKDIINSKGETIGEFIEPTYGDGSALTWEGFKNGLFPINGGTSYINEQGIEVIKSLNGGKRFNGGFAWAKNYKNKWGIINTHGKFVLKAKYDKAYDYENGFACVSLNKKYGVIDRRGKIIVPISCDHIIKFSEGFFEFERGNKVFYTNMKGKLLFSFNAQEGTGFQGGTAVLSHNGSQAVINNKGKIIINYGKYNELTQLGLGSIAYISNQKCGVFNTSGKVIIQPVFDSIDYDAKDNVFIVCQNEKCGLADINGKIITKPKYDGIEGLVFENYKNGLCGLLNSKGKVVLPEVYNKLVVEVGGYIYYVKGNEIGYLNSQKKCIWKYTKK